MPNDTLLWTDLEPGQEPPEMVITPEMELAWLRVERNRRLADTDWTQGADVPDGIKSAYQPYRQALREITDNYTTLGDVVWPVEPA
jgi:hypothetical protein